MQSKCFSPFILLVITLLSAACSSSPPLIQGIELDPKPSEAVPLAAVVAFQTDRPTTVALEFDDGERNWVADTKVPAAMNHVVPILGMRPGRTHTIRVVVTDEDGVSASSEPLEVTTDALPEDFPPIDVRISVPDRMEPGVTLLEPSYSPEDGSQNDYQFLVAIDEAGEVVWYYKAVHGVSDAQRLQNGNLLYRSGNAHLYEIDMLGNLVSNWRSDLAAADRIRADSVHVATDTLHHEALETPSGNIMAISTEVRTYDDYPTSETDPDAPRMTSDVVGDVLVEFTRQGQVDREIGLLDLFDPYRIGYGSLGRFWANTYPTGSSPPRDWSHANGIAVDETGRYLLVSMRRQAVAKLDLETNEVVWILGDHKGWGPEWQHLLLEPQGELTWQSDQHAAMFTPQGTILMFDNGASRARPFDPPMAPEESFSRAVEYSVDEERMEVREIWSYGGPGEERFFARRVGDADWMPETGNVLVTYGGLSTDADGNSISGGGGHDWVRIVEVTHDSPAEEVFELFVDDERPRGWLSFQAERLPSLYP